MPLKWGLWFAGVLVLAGCLALAIALAPSRGTTAAAPAASAGAQRYNNSFTTAAIDACVRTVRPSGIPAYTLDGAVLPYTLATGHEPGTRPRCRDGELRILRLAAGLTVGGQPAYVRRGGCESPCIVRQPTALVAAGDLTRPVELLPPAVLAGDGAPAAGCANEVHNAPSRVVAGLGHMYYKTPTEIGGTKVRTGVAGAGALWSNYGDPGRRFASAAGVSADYNYLLWNLPRTASGVLPGGGIVEAPIADGQAVALCAVPRLTLPSFDRSGLANGSVSFGYARVLGGASAAPIYGWLLLGYQYHRRPFRATTTA